MARRISGEGWVTVSLRKSMAGGDDLFDLTSDYWNAWPATSAPATVRITVSSLPVANADAYAINQDQVLGVDQAVGVLANDTNADGNALSATLVTGPAHGQLTLNPMAPSAIRRPPAFGARTASATPP